MQRQMHHIQADAICWWPCTCWCSVSNLSCHTEKKLSGIFNKMLSYRRETALQGVL